MDCDIMARGSVARLFERADPRYAVMCVKHWSSVMLFNCDHEANKMLTTDMLNIVPGRDLHRFCWLKDEEIGELSPIWNYLVGHTEVDSEPQLVHFTDGIPSMRGYENCEYADEYRMELELWAA
jgi:hypothetical protein